MRFFKFSIILIFYLFVCSKAFSQTDNVKAVKIQVLFDKLYYAQTDSVKKNVNNLILIELKDYLQEKHKFKEDFKNINNLYVVESDDRYVSVFTWAIQYADREYEYFGFIKYFERNEIAYYVEQLHDNQQITGEVSSKKIYSENWYGAVYYKMITKKYKKQRHYVLLGWDANDDFTNKKIIDVLYLEDDDTPVFGKNVIDYNGRKISRLIFEYNERSSMMLNFDKKKDVIIWDHLSPSKQELKGHYRYYGPDLSFDALKYEKGFWKFMSDIEIEKK